MGPEKWHAVRREWLRLRRLWPCLIGLLVVGGPSGATSTTVNGAVTAGVVSSCAITTTPVAFGAYTGAQIDVAGSVTAYCVNGTNWTIALGPGAGRGATTTSRSMTAGPYQLPYALYSDAARTRIWGNNVGIDTVSGVGDGTSQMIPVYGRVPEGSVPGVGVYVDTVIASITF